MLVCALDLLKNVDSNDVKNRKTSFWSQYQSLKRHEVIHLKEKPDLDALDLFKKCNRYSKEVKNRKTLFWSQCQSFFGACLCSISVQEV